MIIALGGKIGSGKSSIADMLVGDGWVRLSFATRLKEIVAWLIGVRPEEINSLKNVRATYSFGTAPCIYIARETGLPLEKIEPLLAGRVFFNVRSVLQYIGTDVIRAIDPDWHCRTVRDRILSDPGKNYVIDDLRFRNELEMVRSFDDSKVFYIDRPGLERNWHESEHSLEVSDFDKDEFITNDGTLDELFRKVREKL